MSAPDPQRPTVDVLARGLLGRVLHGHDVAVRITEVEAYGGIHDPASHAFSRTARSEIMYGDPWRLYVYRSYGIHLCANVVTGPTETASAVLVRAGEQLTQPGDYDLVVADVDRLRRLNEALGHERTDLVLSALGSRLNAAFAHDANAARIGEDEFAVLAPRGNGMVAERVREALEQPLRVAGFDIYPTVSIGSAGAEGGPDAPDVAELLRRVELAVEQAKTAGRGGAALSSPHWLLGAGTVGWRTGFGCYRCVCVGGAGF